MKCQEPECELEASVVIRTAENGSVRYEALCDGHDYTYFHSFRDKWGDSAITFDWDWYPGKPLDLDGSDGVLVIYLDNEAYSLSDFA